MGLLKAGTGAVGGVLADQWREFFYCDSLDANVLAAKGQKRTSAHGRSSNTKGEDNIISDGSIVAVNEGQCMIIVEQGAVVEVCAEPGEFVFESSSEPSVFAGNLGDSIRRSFETLGRRFTFGGDTGRDQRIYFFNTKEIVGNKYGTASPVPFRVVDRNIGLDVDIAVRCNGEYSYRLVDPLLFYKNVCGNIQDVYTRDRIDSQLKSELLTALQPAFAKISEMGIRYSAVPGHTMELSRALNEVLSDSWAETRGIQVAALIKELQKAAVMRDPTMAAANLAAAQSDAMRAAASNEGGAMAGFMGLGLAGMAGGMGAGNLFQMGAQQQATPPAPDAAPASPNTWACGCGAVNVGKFCMECGAPKPSPAGSWTCSCGSVNTGRFCPECGSPRPETAEWTCSCGAVNTGKFCMECGRPHS